jgi:DNA-binding winged helix-turn-helix (wHTH) protein
MLQSSNKLYEFGAFRLDAAERVLWHGEEMLALPSKVFDTLWMLVTREGRVVSKSELMDAVWADAFVEESNLSQNIYTLRRTLGVDEQGRQFIETVPRRGYRFAVPVKLIGEVSTDGSKEAERVGAAGNTTTSPAESIENVFKSPSVNLSTYDSTSIEAPQTPLASTSAEEVRPSSPSRYALLAGLGVLIQAALANQHASTSSLFKYSKHRLRIGLLRRPVLHVFDRLHETHSANIAYYLILVLQLFELRPQITADHSGILRQPRVT